MILVERFFGELTQDVIREGSFSSVSELVADITSYLAERNLNPKAKGEEILPKIQRGAEGPGGATGRGWLAYPILSYTRLGRAWSCSHRRLVARLPAGGSAYRRAT